MASESPETEPWLRGLREGEPAALATLFLHYRPRLRTMVRLRMDRRLAVRVDASDVLQEAYLDAARQLPAYLVDPRVDVYVWLRGLAWKRLLKLHRQHLGAQCRAAGRELVLPVASSASLAVQLLAPGSSPSKAIQREELRQQVQRALARLHADDGEVIVMRTFEDMSHAEVAQALGISEAAATMRYGRALFRLKEALKAEGPSGECQP